MHATENINLKSKAEFYAAVAREVESLVAGEPNVVANLANVSALLNLHLDRLNWVGFYLWHEDTRELVLGPFQGKPACIRLGDGKGVCGTAAATRTAQVVADVQDFPGHIACDPNSRSEVVIPIVQRGRLIGVLDIDSPQLARFDHEDAAGLGMVVEVLTERVDFGSADATATNVTAAAADATATNVTAAAADATAACACAARRPADPSR